MIAGMGSGACNAALLAVINSAVQLDRSSSTLLWGFAGLCLVLPLARFTSEFLTNKLGQGVMYRLRMQLCSQILTAPLRHLEQIGMPRLMAALNDDVPAITAAVLTLPLVCVNTSLVIGCLVYMGILSPVLLLIVAGFMAIGIMSYQIPIAKVTNLFGLARRDADMLQEHFRALIEGAKELKVHSGRRRAFMTGGLEKTSSSFLRHNLSAQNLNSAASSWGQTLVFVVIGLILFLLPSVRHLNSTMKMAYALTLLYMTTPLQVVLNTLPHLSRANVALTKIEELGLTLAHEEPEQLEERVFSATECKSLELKSIVHSYRQGGDTKDFVLGPIDLSFRAGEMVFVVGGNGSGKTTFMKLLTGLYVPKSGHILLNNEQISITKNEFYRQHFSSVFFDFYLFEQMLGLANPQLDDRAREYIAQLGLAHKVQIVDGTLSTTDLSQGQRKRLALLTAYLEDRPIYVFDEWAADQDANFKSLFYLRLLPELKAKGKTIFVISHDDRYYHVADRIIKLEEGKVVSDTPKIPESFVLQTSG